MSAALLRSGLRHFAATPLREATEVLYTRPLQRSGCRADKEWSGLSLGEVQILVGVDVATCGPKQGNGTRRVALTPAGKKIRDEFFPPSRAADAIGLSRSPLIPPGEGPESPVASAARGGQR